MNPRPSHLLVVTVLALVAGGAMAQDKGTRDAADKLHATALQEPNSGKAAEMLCKAAGMVPKNAEYQNDCSGAKRAVLDADQRNLTRAIDAGDAGKLESAKNYARMVSNLDAKLHEQAQQLIAKWTPQEKPAAPPVPADQSAAQLAKAESAFEAGNLQGAKTAAEQVTDPAIKPSAGRLVSEVDSYSSLVSTGQHHEEAKEYAQAVNSYQSALAINSHVGADDLNGKIQRLHQQIASAAQQPPPQPAPAPAPVAVARNLPPTPAAKPQEPSMADKKKKLEDAYASALNRKDMEGAERELRQVVQLDPGDADAKGRLMDIQKQLAEALNRDPVKLEKTLHDAIAAFYASQFEDAESDLNRYLGADAGKKKGAAYFYLGATEEARGLLETPSRHSSRQTQARVYFKQAHSAGYQPVQKYVSEKILQAWQQAGM